MTSSAKTTERLLLPAAILFCVTCTLIAVTAFASDWLPLCPHNSGFRIIQTPTSWLFAVLFFVVAVDHLSTARKEKTRVKKLRIFFDILACLTLAALPYLHAQAFTGDLRWIPGLVLCPLSGWLAYRLARSVRFPAMMSAMLAIGFTAVLSWPFVIHEYNIGHRPDCVNEPSLPQPQAPTE